MKKLFFLLALITVVAYVGTWRCLPRVLQDYSGLNADDNADALFFGAIGLGCFVLAYLTGSIGLLYTSTMGGRSVGLAFGIPAIMAGAISSLIVLTLSDGCPWRGLAPVVVLWSIPLLLGCLSIWYGYRKQPSAPLGSSEAQGAQAAAN
jgi:hypothetical protein